MFFIDESTGWICGSSGYIAKSTDGGDTWNTQVTNTEIYIQDVTFVDENNGWAVGRSGLILSTTDGGSTWVVDENPSSDHLLKVDFVNLLEGWAVGSNGTIVKYTSPNSSIDPELIDENLISIYPNPVLDFATIEINRNTKPEDISIYNMSGQKVNNDNIRKVDEKQYQFSRKNLPSGMYTLTLNIGGHQQSHSMILK